MSEDATCSTLRDQPGSLNGTGSAKLRNMSTDPPSGFAKSRRPIPFVPSYIIDEIKLKRSKSARFPEYRSSIATPGVRMNHSAARRAFSCEERHDPARKRQVLPSQFIERGFQHDPYGGVNEARMAADTSIRNRLSKRAVTMEHFGRELENGTT